MPGRLIKPASRVQELNNEATDSLLSKMARNARHHASRKDCAAQGRVMRKGLCRKRKRAYKAKPRAAPIRELKGMCKQNKGVWRHGRKFGGKLACYNRKVRKTKKHYLGKLSTAGHVMDSKEITYKNARALHKHLRYGD